jgi:Na+/glutamate symporter
MLAASIGLALVVSVAKIPVIGMLVAASATGGFGTPSAWCSWSAWPAIPRSCDRSALPGG